MKKTSVLILAAALLASLWAGWPSAAVAKSAPGVFRFAAYGDNRSGWREDGVHRRLLLRMRADAPEVILHTGDIVYRGDRKDHWEAFFRDGADVFSRIPLLPSVGNHDLSRDNRFATLFPLGQDGATYYSVRRGGITFVALDTTIDYTPESPQYRFLVKTLKAASGRGPVIVFFHHPPFNAGKHGDDEGVKRHLVPVFAAYKVPLVLTGHDHNYQRFTPVDGVTYIVTGGGGGPLYGLKKRADLAEGLSVHHYLLLEASSKAIKIWVKGENGATLAAHEIRL